MSDRALSGFILIAAAAYGAYLYWRHLQSGGGGAASPAGAPPAGSGASSLPTAAGGSPLAKLLGFAQAENLHVTSGEHFTTNGQAVMSAHDLAQTGHTTGSLHYQGRAIDVGVGGLSAAQIGQVIADATANGFRVLKELYTGQGPYGESSGPHLHIEAPASRFAQVAP